MAWFSDLAGKAESLLNNLDEQTGAAFRNHNVKKKQNEILLSRRESTVGQKKRNQKPPRKSSPSPTRSIQSPVENRLYRSPNRETVDPKTAKAKRFKSPQRQIDNKYTLDYPPQTLVSDIRNYVEHSCNSQKSNSLPKISKDEDWLFNMQNLEVENVMMKNELNVMGKEFMELLFKLRKTEDGNVHSQELKFATDKLESVEKLHSTSEIECLISEIKEMRNSLPDLIEQQLMSYKEKTITLQNELDALRSTNENLEEKTKELQDKSNNMIAANKKLENDLRHTQSTVADLRTELKRRTDECRQLEKEWETYKVRVKKMLKEKDTEIKSLHEGMNSYDDTENLINQIENLKKERNELSAAVESMRGEILEMKKYVSKLEGQYNAAERVLTVLRDALREERLARSKADAQHDFAVKDLKSLQLETGQMFLMLQNALREKDEELSRIRESSVRSEDTSALNVADYDMKQEAIDKNKIQYLSQMLIQRQGKIDKLLAHNNTLKIQLEKYEAKLKSDLTDRTNKSQSVVQLHDESRPRTRAFLANNSLSAVSVRIGIMIKRYPFLRLFILFYMFCLHFWVLTVLFTSTPDIARPSKS